LEEAAKLRNWKYDGSTSAMADQLYLSYWLNSFSEFNMFRPYEKDAETVSLFQTLEERSDFQGDSGQLC